MGMVGAVLRCCGVGGDCKQLNSLCFGAEEGMWAGRWVCWKACGRWCGGNIVVGGEKWWAHLGRCGQCCGWRGGNGAAVLGGVGV